MSKKATFILICGLSGAGKTTLAKQIAESMNLKYLGADEFYEKVNGDEQIHTNKFEVWIELFKAVHECETDGIDCIVDSNALSASGRDEFINWFPNFDHHLIYVDADDTLRLLNNHCRKRKIPDDVMMGMRAKAEPPVWCRMDKKWKSLIRIQNFDNCYTIIQREGDVPHESIENMVR